MSYSDMWQFSLPVHWVKLLMLTQVGSALTSMRPGRLTSFARRPNCLTTRLAWVRALNECTVWVWLWTVDRCGRILSWVLPGYQNCGVTCSFTRKKGNLIAANVSFLSGVCLRLWELLAFRGGRCRPSYVRARAGCCIRLRCHAVLPWVLGCEC